MLPMKFKVSEAGGSGNRLFILAILLTAAIRLYLLRNYYCISSDGVHYIDAAKDFFTGNVASGLSSVYPPGYPILIAALYPIIGDWELSGQIWSILFGVLLLLPLYVLFRQLYGEKAALVACFLVAVSPFLARYSVHVRTESPFLFLSTTALLLFHQGIERKSQGRFFLGGWVAGFAYLVRPEAVGFLAIVPAILAFQWLSKKAPGLLWLCKTSSLVFVGFLLFALPYIVYLSSETGRWGAVTRKAGITLAISLMDSGLLDEGPMEGLGNVESLVFTEFIQRHPVLYLKKVGMDILPAVGVFFEALHYTYVPFLLVGLIFAFRERFWDRKDFLLLGFLLFYVFGFTLFYVKRRYSLQVVPISLGWTAMGMLWCWDWLARTFSAKTARALLFLLALVLAGGTLPKTLKPVSPEKAYVREAGRYLKERKGTRALRVLVFDDRITFYADADPIALTELNKQELVQYIRERKADYLAAELRVLTKHYPDLARDPAPYRLSLEKEFRGSRNDRLLVYRVS